MSINFGQGYSAYTFRIAIRSYCAAFGALKASVSDVIFSELFTWSIGALVIR